MAAAVAYVSEGNSLREASRLYNVPVETLRRRVNKIVALRCQPGPSIVLTKDEEYKMCKYIIDMADMGFGLTKEDIMSIAFRIY